MAIGTRTERYEILARAAERLAADLDLQAALEVIAGAAADATGAALAVIRVLDPRTGSLVARAAAPPASPLAAEVAGSRARPEDAFLDRAHDPGFAVLAPARSGDRLVGAVELYDAAGGLGDEARSVAQLLAAQLAQTLRHARALDPRGRGLVDPVRALEQAGEALAAGALLSRAAQHAVLTAAAATGASNAAIWRSGEDRLEPIAAQDVTDRPSVERRRELAAAVLESRKPVSIDDAGPGEGTSCVVSVQLGQPAFGILQLCYPEKPPAEELDALTSFAVRVGHALRAGERARDLQLELERARALLSVVGEATAHLSLAHTLETALERFVELLAIDRVGIYLRDGGTLLLAAGRELVQGHEDVALALLGLALGPLRARDTIEARLGSPDRPAASVRQALRAAGVEAALAVPLRVHDEPIGLLVAYPGERRLEESERALLASLAAQLAIAVQNARLHDQTKELGTALGAALDSERQAARQLGALYEISRAFAQSLSLETTLQAVTTTAVEVLGLDAAVIGVPGERGDEMVAGAIHVADERLAGVLRTMLERPHPPGARLTGPLVLDAERATALGGAHGLLVPFLERGSTAAVVPIETPTELLALLTIVSLDSESPISAETIGTATTIAAQAALAIDNARLYQQQKAFAETIQQALLPRARPRVAGLELGAVYESAARVDVGGDVYDFVELADGRLAVVLGDVTGHGIDATADMAMAKFVFRSLVREHSEPGDFLAHANEVVTGEIESGKFITMIYLAIDAGGAVACASAGHPAPRLVLPEGRVEELPCRGLALGIAGSQTYAEARGVLPPGAAVVLYTDGAIEARADGELYGVERLDTLLLERRGLSAQELAEAVLADCRAYGGSDLADDCAVVVVKVA